MVNEVEQSSTNLSLIAGGGAVILLLILSSLIMAKIRRNKFEDELIESWDTLSKPNSSKDYPELEVTSSVDGTKEVVNDLWSQLEQEEGLNWYCSGRFFLVESGLLSREPQGVLVLFSPILWQIRI